MSTKIEWAEEVWNPIVGCSKVSKGCQNCYAERMAKRLAAMGQDVYRYTIDERGRWNGVLQWAGQEALERPLRWKKPRMIFVNSMSDLFHDQVPGDWIADVFRVMERCPQHQFLILTKRAVRMYLWFREYNGERALENVWLGASVEDQKAADVQIPWLLKTPAAVRFVSCEPLLGAVNLQGVHDPMLPMYYDALSGMYFSSDAVGHPSVKLDWVIAGGESGPRARPMHPDWARELRDQCQQTGTAFFFKQWGEWAPLEDHPKPVFRNTHDRYGRFWHPDDVKNGGHAQNVGFEKNVVGSYGQHMVRIGKKSAGRLLDGREWNEMPTTGWGEGK